MKTRIFSYMKIIALKVLPFIVTLALICYWVMSEYVVAKAATPPSGEVTLADFLNSKIQVRNARKVLVDDKTYTFVVGVYHKGFFLLAFPSGPPIYIFDERDILIEWYYDSGDSMQFKEKWEKYNIYAQPLFDIRKENNVE